MIKLIASDIDGTLLVEGTREINPEIFEVIKKLKEKDILFAAASGRPYSSMSLLFEPVKDDMIFITENGSYVCCRGYAMMESLVDWELIREWVEEARKIPGTSFTIDTEEGLYTESNDPGFLSLLRDGYGSTTFVVDDVLAEEKKVIKTSIYKEKGIETVRDLMVPRWEDRLHCAIAGEIWLDFMNKGTNKGKALRSIQETLHISPDETMVFGDNYNDLELIMGAAESYAVGNAVEPLKKAAKYIADTNVNDGVLKVLKTLL